MSSSSPSRESSGSMMSPFGSVSASGNARLRGVTPFPLPSTSIAAASSSRSRSSRVRIPATSTSCDALATAVWGVRGAG
eukprot:scaffold415_cov124-Isochrysis_galbana.AAC.10